MHGRNNFACCMGTSGLTWDEKRDLNWKRWICFPYTNNTPKNRNNRCLDCLVNSSWNVKTYIVAKNFFTSHALQDQNSLWMKTDLKSSTNAAWNMSQISSCHLNFLMSQYTLEFQTLTTLLFLYKNIHGLNFFLFCFMSRRCFNRS